MGETSELQVLPTPHFVHSSDCPTPIGPGLPNAYTHSLHKSFYARLEFPSSIVDICRTSFDPIDAQPASLRSSAILDARYPVDLRPLALFFLQSSHTTALLRSSAILAIVAGRGIGFRHPGFADSSARFGRPCGSTDASCEGSRSPIPRRSRRSSALRPEPKGRSGDSCGSRSRRTRRSGGLDTRAGSKAIGATDGGGRFRASEASHEGERA